MRSDKSMGAVSASAADLKFLHRLRQTHFRNFKSKSGTRIICLLVPLLLPKFVSEGAAMYHELRNQRDTSKSMILVPLLNPKFAIGLLGTAVRTSGSGRWPFPDLNEIPVLIDYRRPAYS